MINPENASRISHPRASGLTYTRHTVLLVAHCSATRMGMSPSPDARGHGLADDGASGSARIRRDYRMALRARGGQQIADLD